MPSATGLFDPFALSPEVDRYAIFAEFRAAGPFAWGVEPFPGSGKPLYVFSHRLFREMLKHPGMLQAPPGDYEQVRRELGKNRFWAMMFRTILLADPPRHGELRRPMSRDFSPAGIAALQASLQTKALEIAHKCRKAGSFDLVTDFSIPFIFTGLEKILGIPLEDPATLKRLTNDLAVGLDFREDSETTAANSALDEIVQLIETLLPSAGDRPGLIGGLIKVRDQGLITHEDLLANVIFLLFAGQETIVDMIGNAVMALHQHQDLEQRLRNGPADWVKAADELLRFDPSVQFTGARLASEDTQIDDMFIPAGTGVVGVVGSANRDHKIYENADLLNFDREPEVQSLSFGWGSHLCLGRNIARLELQIALETLYRFLPPWELEESGCVRRPSVNWRGMRSVPIRINA
jgi:cytochrome P450